MKNYETILFDCDGVVLNSNKIKSQAFYQVASAFSIPAAHELVEYNRKFGGVSRHEKFEHFRTNILSRYSEDEPTQEWLVGQFATYVKNGLMQCEVSPHLEDIRLKFPLSEFAVISGGDEAELRQIFKDRDIDHYFSGGIWGSPASKYDIINSQFSDIICGSTLFIGDSELDFRVAKSFGFDFIFLSDWTEMLNWRLFCEQNYISNFRNIGEYVNIT